MGASKKWWDDVGLGPLSYLGKSMSKSYRKSAVKGKAAKRSSADRAMISSAGRSGSGTVAKKSGKIAKRVGRKIPKPSPKKPSPKRPPSKRPRPPRKR
jgi:hypothetical protein